jgi:hypothetical protein
MAALKIPGAYDICLEVNKCGKLIVPLVGIELRN